MRSMKTIYGGTCLSHNWHRHMEVVLESRADAYLQAQEERALLYFEDLHRQEHPGCQNKICLS